MHIAVAREHAGDCPVRVAEMQHAADHEPTKLLRGARACDQLAHGRTKHAAVHDLELGTYPSKLQTDAAQGDVGVGAGVDLRHVHHGDELARHQSPAARVLGEARRIADGIHIRAGQIAVELGVGAAAQEDPPVGPAGIRERVPESGAHRKHRHQYGDHARDADDDHARGAEALRQGLQTHQDDGTQLLEHFAASYFWGHSAVCCAQRLSANASTIFSRIARSAGGSPTISASNTAAPIPGTNALGDSSRPCNPCLMMGSVAKLNASPMTPAIMHSRRDSARTSPSTLPSPKPRVFRTASSGMRSRTDCIIVLPVRNRSVKNTAPKIARRTKPMSPNCLTKAI